MTNIHNNRIINIGEGITILGIMIAIGLTGNYWLLILLILPVVTWAYVDDNLRMKSNNYIEVEARLRQDIMREELRLLRIKKK